MKDLKVLFLDANKEQQIDFLLPENHEYHNIKVISKQYTYRDKKLINEEYKLPIAVTYVPSDKEKEDSCKRFFISQIIRKIKEHLVGDYSFFFAIKTVKELQLNIIKTLDVFDSSQYTYQLNAKLVVEYNKEGVVFNEEFVFSEVSLVLPCKLKTATTLPPVYWHIVRNYLNIPKGTLYSFNDKIITFTVNGIKYELDIVTEQLTW